MEEGKTKRDLVLPLRHRLLSHHKSQQLKRFQSGSTMPWKRVRLPVLPWETDTQWDPSGMEMSYPDCWAPSHYQMLKCLTYLLLCGLLLSFLRTRAGAAAFSCGVRWTLPWKPRKQKTPPTRVARCWVAEVVFYFFWASLLKDTKFRVCKTSLNENKTSPITKMQTCWKGKCSSIQVSENMRAKVLERIS